MPAELPSWFRLEVNAGATLDRPGIYEWRIEGVGTYIGKYTHSSRPMKEYQRNILRLLTGKPYRRAKPDGFRYIHRVLAAAVTDQTPVFLTILENLPPADLASRERALIKQRGTLNRQ